MGEWSQYDQSFKQQMVKIAVKNVKGQAEILAGITANSLFQCLENMHILGKYNPDAYAVMLPLPTTSRYEPLDYILTVLDAADRPVYYYHCPPVTKVDFYPQDFERLLMHPNLKGIKNSAGDIGVRKELLLLKRKYNFILLEGHEWGIDEALIAGCDGVLCGMAALAGKLMVQITQAINNNNIALAQNLQFTLLEIFHGIYGINTTDVHIGHKYALKCRGIFNSYICRNTSKNLLSEMAKQRIRQCLKNYKEFI